jgi:hypothetical protein
MALEVDPLDVTEIRGFEDVYATFVECSVDVGPGSVLGNQQFVSALVDVLQLLLQGCVSCGLR